MLLNGFDGGGPEIMSKKLFGQKMNKSHQNSIKT
jgi:hypothetical protein